ncbi:hypothetical protein J6590_023524 [Homalodisca vitripennis]|nr:hypothetical protein J6590_023524 [Homalodisca vitripennis]
MLGEDNTEFRTIQRNALGCSLSQIRAASGKVQWAINQVVSDTNISIDGRDKAAIAPYENILERPLQTLEELSDKLERRNVIILPGMRNSGFLHASLGKRP